MQSSPTTSGGGINATVDYCLSQIHAQQPLKAFDYYIGVIGKLISYAPTLHQQILRANVAEVMSQVNSKLGISPQPPAGSGDGQAAPIKRRGRPPNVASADVVASQEANSTGFGDWGGGQSQAVVPTRGRGRLSTSAAKARGKKAAETRRKNKLANQGGETLQEQLAA